MRQEEHSTSGDGTEARLSIAAAVRAACLQAALEAYEDAGLRGLCAEGRWECAIDALRSLPLAEIVPGDDAPPVGETGSAG